MEYKNKTIEIVPKKMISLRNLTS